MQRAIDRRRIGERLGERGEQGLVAIEVTLEGDAQVVRIEQHGVVGAGIRLDECCCLAPGLAAAFRRPIGGQRG